MNSDLTNAAGVAANDRSFALRARLLSSLDDGGLLYLEDGVIATDSAGRIAFVGPAIEYKGGLIVQDLRPMVIAPGLIDTHAHLPQAPITGLGGGMTLLPWLENVMAPAERRFAGLGVKATAEHYFSLFAAAGTTTATLYGSVDAEATEASFQAARDHGLRIVLGQCLMDRMRYDDAPEEGITERRLAESEALCRRWHGEDEGRLQYAFTPRFALSCSPKMLQESARLAKAFDAYWQTHVSEDPEEMVAVKDLFPEARDYLDVYDLAGGLGPKTILAHGVHMSDRELARVLETGAAIAHCPSNIGGGGGILDLGRYRALGLRLGLASDIGGCTDISMFKAMELGQLCQTARRKLLPDSVVMTCLADWFELATLGGARLLGLEDRIGSLEIGKDADLIAVDVEGLKLVESAVLDSVQQVLGHMVARARPDMVRAVWVRGRKLAGPGMFDR